MSRYLFLLRQVIARRPEPELDPSGFASAVERISIMGHLTLLLAEETHGTICSPNAPFSRSPILKILRERNRPFSQWF
jgi:hypothetical protein